MAQSKIRIAVADDEPSVPKLVARVLRMHHFDVWVEPNCGTILRTLAATPDGIDLLVTDQSMPGMTGAELVRNARVYAPDLPVLLITGYSADLASSDVNAWGASAYLTKPLDIFQLVEQVESLLKLPRVGVESAHLKSAQAR